MMNFQDHMEWHSLISGMSREQLLEQMSRMVALLGEQKFCEAAASNLIAMSFLEKAVPESLHQFTRMIVDGITCFISRCGHESIQAAVLKQCSLPMDCSPAERLLNLVEQFPTLHKFGQIVARRPDVDPFFQQFLTQLEHGRVTSAFGDIQPYLENQLGGFHRRKDIRLGTKIIAEASVAAIVPFTLVDRGGTVEGVFKVLRPGIAEQLERELEIVKDVLHFFEKKRRSYPLEDMDITGLFREIREDLQRETDLVAEQRNLQEAARFYQNIPHVHIPKLFSFSTRNVSAMERLTGVPLAQMSLSGNARKRLARLIFEALICRPLFALEEMAPFHGDPHSGNILALPGTAGRSVGIGLIDWTLASYLPRRMRRTMVDFIIGIATADRSAIADSLMLLQRGEKRDFSSLVLRVLEELEGENRGEVDPMWKSFRVLEKLTMAGVVFPPELILFRKSFFTLEGVLLDLCEGFSPGKTMEDFIRRLIVEELPARFSNGCLPWVTPQMDYRSMISDAALQRAALSSYLTFYQKITDGNLLLWQTQAMLVNDFWKFFTRPGQ